MALALFSLLLYFVIFLLWEILVVYKPDLWWNNIVKTEDSFLGEGFSNKSVLVLFYHIIRVVLLFLYIFSYYACNGCSYVVFVFGSILCGINLGVLITDLLEINDENFDLEEMKNI